MLTAIQNELFDLGADLATPGEDFAPSEMTLRIVQPQIDRLEREIDSMNEGLEPLRSFILPAGGGGAACLHLARAIVRRAERSAVAAAAGGRRSTRSPSSTSTASPTTSSSWPRLAAAGEGGEVLWQPGATRIGSCSGELTALDDFRVRGRRWRPRQTSPPAAALAERYRAVRALSEAIAAPLSDADATLQPMPDASPAKWHLAHTSWFFETFVLRDHVAGHRLWDESWAYLFNSYYEGEGERHPRDAPRHAQPPEPRRDPRLARLCRRGASPPLCRACPGLRWPWSSSASTTSSSIRS